MVQSKGAHDTSSPDVTRITNAVEMSRVHFVLVTG
jgi:hypothetical protein